LPVVVVVVLLTVLAAEAVEFFKDMLALYRGLLIL
jgi:hypothetical protein